jgi:hypothetical protein
MGHTCFERQLTCEKQSQNIRFFGEGFNSSLPYLVYKLETNKLAERWEMGR